jgi:NADH-quinone oxidoreductase subunit L
VHHQYFHYHPPQQKPVSKIKATLYMLGIREWNLDTLMFKYVWSPFKWIGRKLQFLEANIFIPVLLLAGIGFSILAYFSAESGQSLRSNLPLVLLSVALAVILFAFSSRQSAVKVWVYLLTGHFFIIAAVLFNAHDVNTIEIIFYATGILIAFLLGYYCLHKTKSIDNDISLNQYHGYVYEQETTGFLFLLAAIGMLGFPITTAFIGIDVLFTYVHNNQIILIVLLALCFIFIELAAFRILLRIFMGPHKKLNHPVAFRSS